MENAIRSMNSHQKSASWTIRRMTLELQHYCLLFLLATTVSGVQREMDLKYQLQNSTVLEAQFMSERVRM